MKILSNYRQTYAGQVRKRTSPLASVVTLRLKVAGGGGGLGSGGTTQPHAAALGPPGLGTGSGCGCWANKLVEMHARPKARLFVANAVSRSFILPGKQTACL